MTQGSRPGASAKDHPARYRVAFSASLDPLGKSPLHRENHKPNLQGIPWPDHIFRQFKLLPNRRFRLNFNGFGKRLAKEWRRSSFHRPHKTSTARRSFRPYVSLSRPQLIGQRPRRDRVKSDECGDAVSVRHRRDTRQNMECAPRCLTHRDHSRLRARARPRCRCAE
jgi:hypothetical protein